MVEHLRAVLRGTEPADGSGHFRAIATHAGSLIVGERGPTRFADGAFRNSLKQTSRYPLLLQHADDRVIGYPVWMGIGFTVILFLAGLQGVDENLYDAGRIDGADNLQLLRYITIPQMVPVLLFITVTGLVGSMQMWEVPRLITSGNPNFATYTLGYSIMQDSFGALDMGMGTAESLVLFVMLLVFIGWQLNQYRKQYKV